MTKSLTACHAAAISPVSMTTRLGRKPSTIARLWLCKQKFSRRETGTCLCGHTGRSGRAQRFCLMFAEASHDVYVKAKTLVFFLRGFQRGAKVTVPVQECHNCIGGLTAGDEIPPANQPGQPTS